jgi:HD-GYP domain-containing protein (c-di-GMP phosphodiesterase class II)
VGVADPFDAMINDRPYRDAMPVAAAFDVIEEEAGRQFDPQVSAAAPRRREQRAQVQDSGDATP